MSEQELTGGPLLQQVPAWCLEDTEHAATLFLLSHLWPDGRIRRHLHVDGAGVTIDFHKMLREHGWSSGERLVVRAALSMWCTSDAEGAPLGALISTLGDNWLGIVWRAVQMRRGVPASHASMSPVTIGGDG